MASYGAKTVAVTSYDDLIFVWSIKSQSTENNTTTINWYLRLDAKQNGRISSTASKQWSVTINGKSYSGTNTVGISAGDSRTLASGTQVISHNSDGTKTFSYSFSQEFAITFSGTWIGTKSGSGSGTLDTIPRASSLSIDDNKVWPLETKRNFTITPKDASFKHKITYTVGSTSGYIAGNSSEYANGTSASWTPPLSLSRQNTTGLYLDAKIYLKTYNSSGTQIGTYLMLKTLYIPASVAPSCFISESDSTGLKSTFGDYVQNKSKISVKLTITNSYSATTSSSEITVNGSKYNGSSVEVTTTKAGSQTVSARVTDSRGRIDAESIPITVLEYISPSLKKLSVSRCNEDGTLNNEGAFVKVSFSSKIYPLNNKNTATYTLEYKKSSTSEYTSVSLTDYANNFDISDGSYIFSADTSSTYDVQLTAQDELDSQTKAVTAPTAFTLIHWGQDGTSMAIGKIAEKEKTLQVALASEFVGSVYGNAYGIGELPDIPSNADLDDYVSSGCWSIKANSVAETISNMPKQIAGKLIVENINGQKAGYDGFLYYKQTYKPYNGYAGYPVYMRYFYRDGSGIYYFDDWGAETSVRKYHRLWSGSYVMNESQTCTLSENVSMQPNGIVLSFRTRVEKYGAYQYVNHFIPKGHILGTPGDVTEIIPLLYSDTPYVWFAYKRLLINNTQVKGHSDNMGVPFDKNGTQFFNSDFYLMTIYGV